jgi:hypothetical protein
MTEFIFFKIVFTKWQKLAQKQITHSTCFVIISRPTMLEPRRPHLSMKEGVLDVFGKLSTRRGAWAWFHGVFGLAVQKLLNIE